LHRLYKLSDVIVTLPLWFGSCLAVGVVVKNGGKSVNIFIAFMRALFGKSEILLSESLSTTEH